MVTLPNSVMADQANAEFQEVASTANGCHDGRGGSEVPHVLAQCRDRRAGDREGRLLLHEAIE
jgi:hypothetical protein